MKGPFWWRENLRLLTTFKSFAKVTVKNGDNCLLWTDVWKDDLLSNHFPELYSFAKNKALSVGKAISQQQHLHQLFHLPMSAIAFDQLHDLNLILSAVEVEETSDVWHIGSTSSTYSSSVVYRILVGEQHVHPMHNWIQDSFCQPKHKVFFWLLIKDRLSTRNILRRRHVVLDSYNCMLCQQSVEETLIHLFFGCPFARDCWSLLNLTVQAQGSLADILESFKLQMISPFFMNSIILMGWTIWTARNDLIFKGLQPSFQSSLNTFQKEIRLLIFRAKQSSLHSFESWCLSLL